jgi:type VI secretion system protein VasG
VVDGFRKNETEMPSFARGVWTLLERGWVNATLLFGETQVRTGHLLVSALQEPELSRA